MKPISIITVAVAIAFAAISPTIGADERAAQNDPKHEALDKRVKRLESLVGQHQTVTPWRPDVLTQLSRLEEEVRGHSRSGPTSPRQQTHARLSTLEGKTAALAKATDTLSEQLEQMERSAAKPKPNTDIPDLRRTIDQLERTVRELSNRVKRLEAKE